MIKQDDTKDPHNHGYQRVETGEGDLSTSTTSTSLDTIVLDSGHDILTSPTTTASIVRERPRGFSPIFETDDGGDSKTKSKASLKGSKVSFQEDQFDSGDDNFSNRRDQFQKNKATSSDHKSIFKVCDFLEFSFI